MSSDDKTGGRLGDPSLLRRLNFSAALSAFVNAPSLTLRELRSVVGVSRPTAEDLLAELLADERVEETAPSSTSSGRTAGRPARHFRFRAESGYVSGIDIGAHKSMAVVTDLRRHGAAGEIGVLPMLGWAEAVERLHARGRTLAAEAGAPSGREGEFVIASAALQDPESLAVLIEFAEVLARGAAVLALAIDPEVVVLGGGMSRGGAIIAEPFRRELAKLTLLPVDVVTSTMGADSVALGAAKMALDEVFADLLNVPGT